ncbi:DUF2470 domain-containing protein [Nocardioides marmoriginsengisoli]|uniref:DUF2470 domain-containing protein n=1 Tax=Nocardioides marmoriginsengisoli TaxID=661483 RepID=A0A3N0CBF0_9ACTN|nr:DUF2470 domain-containing protein [Nocardioides marmoriginsengisoli]RNL60777.1 DUF2470 domain-containing protein [Nocardioides marmoriginsengisoli]
MTRPSTALTLTPAERARTIVASASTLRVVSADLSLDVHRHGVIPDGSLMFQAPADAFLNASGVGDLGQRVTATAVDVTTVPQPDRLRGTLTLAGPVHDVVEPLPAGMRIHLTGSDKPDPSTRLLRLVPDSVGLAWRCEAGDGEPPARQVALADYRCAFPDPLLGYEAEWLPHLQADHSQILTAIARYELGWEEDPDDVRALGIDRFGLVLRVRDAALDGGGRDLRLGFDRSVACGCDVRNAFSALLERALPGYGPIC